VVLFGAQARIQQDCGISLEQRHYASTTINLRLAAVRRLAYEAADCGLLSADLAAGIRRVKGAKRLGVPIGNWLSAEQGKRLLLTPDVTSLRGKRDYATLAILLGCGLRRAELTALRVEDRPLRRSIDECHGIPAYSRCPHPQSGFPEFVFRSGLVFRPTIFRTKASWCPEESGSVTLSPAEFCL